MAPITSSQVLLSPAELSYLHSSLSLNPPIRPDGRTPTQFRPLIAESGILPSANGSARICFGDGTEAIVGVKAEVERSVARPGLLDEDDEASDEEEDAGTGETGTGEDTWTEISIEVPGFRDDDALPIFLAAMLTEALLADGKLKDRLWINRRFHWKLYVDVCASLFLLKASPLRPSKHCSNLSLDPTALDPSLISSSSPKLNNPPRPPLHPPSLP